MVYLSKIILNPYSKAARRDLSNPYQLHASLCRVFANENEKPPRFLWRLEKAQNNIIPIVLVQSESEANWAKLKTYYKEYFKEEPKQNELPLGQLEPEQTLRFRLRANPTVTRQGKRIGLYKHEELIGFHDEQGWHAGWLQRQASKGGFELINAKVSDTERLRFYKHKGGSAITLQAVLFDGTLKIKDVEIFKQTLAKGIGKAKSLGFGLLSIAKGG